MNHPEEAPKLPILPFIIGDVVLIVTAAVIAARSSAPITTGELIAITACVVIGAALAVVPFLANYARRQDAELTERQNQIAALARTTAESAEQLGIAAAGLHGIAETSKLNLDTVAKLPGKIQERIDAVTQQLVGSSLASQNALKANLSQLEAATETLSRTLAKIDSATHAKADAFATAEKDLAAALVRASAQIEALVSDAVTHVVRTSEAATPEPPAPKPSRNKSRTPPAPPPPPTEKEPAQPASTTDVPAPETSSGADIAPPPVDAVPAPTPTPGPSAQPVATPASENDAPFTPAEPDAADVPVGEPETPKPPRPRKTKAANDDGFDLGLTADLSEPAETALSADGFTRLIATAYIGIGNKLFIRGEGPGLSWEKGVPLQFVSIGKWRWETPDATAPLRVKLYKNDQIECRGLGEITLEPAHQHEVNAGF